MKSDLYDDTQQNFHPIRFRTSSDLFDRRFQRDRVRIAAQLSRREEQSAPRFLAATVDPSAGEALFVIGQPLKVERQRAAREQVIEDDTKRVSIRACIDIFA